VITQRLACFGLLALASHIPVEGVAAIGGDQTPPAVRTPVDAGRDIFESTCASGMCHGSGGVGARGPSLKRPLSPELIRDTVQNGRPGTPMPAFKEVFDAGAETQLLAYVTWLSSGGRSPSGAAVIQAPAESAPAAARSGPAAPWLASNVSPQPVPIGSDAGDPRAGVAIFFDATKLYSCRSCHNYSGAGGPIGPDLAKLGKPSIEIYRSISQPRYAGAAYPAIVLTLRDGARVVGIKRDDTDDAVRVYDVSSVPPVSRRVKKSEIAEVLPVTASGIYDHTALPYSKQDLLDVSVFLGKTASP
jgi:putative heme-binding domain-containing protein